MAKLFFTQHRSSIWRTVLFTVFLEFNVVNKCTSNPEICITSNRRNISYFKVDIKEKTWFLAWQSCINRGSILPVICNKNEQDALIEYLRGNVGSSAAWTSGRNINFTDWTWINGQPFADHRGMILPQPESSDTHVILDENRNYKAQNPQRSSFYLCQYSGSSCNSENVINVTKGCVRPSDDDQSWYDARNQCLENGGDFAILQDIDLGILKESNKLQADRSYYIGLRKNTWLWMWQNTTVPTKDTGLEIKYSDWSNGPYSIADGCISIDGSNGGWKAVRCTDYKKVVCQTSSNETTPSTSSVMTSSIPTRSTSTMSSTMSSTKLSATTRSMSIVSESETESSTNVDSQVLRKYFVYSGVCAGIVIIIISIIIVILAVRRRRKRYKDMNRSKDKNNSDQNRLDLSPNKPAASLVNAPANAPAIAPITGADDTQGVYAEISLATINQPEDGARTEQPGVVYASLEFQKEPTYLEPDMIIARNSE